MKMNRYKLLLIALVGSIYGTVINVPDDYDTIQEGIEIQVAEENVEKANELINSEPRLTNQP